MFLWVPVGLPTGKIVGIHNGPLSLVLVAGGDLLGRLILVRLFNYPVASFWAFQSTASFKRPAKDHCWLSGAAELKRLRVKGEQ